MTICSIPGCEKAVHGRGWCKTHYGRWQRHGDPNGGQVYQPRPPVCVIDGCDKPVAARGWCHTHYKRWQTHGDPTIDLHAWNKLGLDGRWQGYLDLSTRTASGCLEWNGPRFDRGYGAFWDGERMWRAPRFAWTKAHGPIPEGLIVRHDCDNPPCVNLDHLRLGTHDDNMADRLERGWYLKDRQEQARLRESVEDGPACSVVLFQPSRPC